MGKNISLESFVSGMSKMKDYVDQKTQNIPTTPSEPSTPQESNQLHFNDNGELEVTINGVTKTYIDKEYCDNVSVNSNGTVPIQLTPMFDTQGNYFNCHGLGIMYYNGKYYAYGESKTGVTSNPGSAAFIPTTGVNCYSSEDLKSWTFENKVIKPNTTDSSSIIHTSKIIERPKCVYNEKNNNFVMFWHADTSDYSLASIGIAVCDTPTGEFTPLGAYRPTGNTSTARDFNVFIDDDKTGYIFVSREENYEMYCHKLNADYTGFTNEYALVIPNRQQREAPAPFKYNGEYYLMTSGCTGWDPNPTKIYKSSTVMGTYIDQGLTCLNDTTNTSYGSQSTYVLPVDRTKFGYDYIAMFDQWNNRDLEASGYLWLPLFLQGGKFYVDNVNKKVFLESSNSMAISLYVNDGNNYFAGMNYENALQYLYKMIKDPNYVGATGISLPETSSMKINGGGRLNYTIYPSNASLSDLSWSSSNTNVATVDISGTITPVGVGVTTITVTTSSGASDSCELTIKEASYLVNSGTTYALHNKTTYSGGQFTDTQTRLLDTNKAFTIVLDFNGSTANTDASSAHCIMHCMRESSPWPGISFAISGGHYSLDYNGGSHSFANLSYNDTARHILVITKAANSNTLNAYLDNTTPITITGSYAYTSVTQNTILGAYQTTTGTKGRYWNGTVNECDILLRVMSSTEIQTIFEDLN